jgi:hypothetical protein
MKHNDIEALKQLLDSGKIWISSGKILQLDLLADRSFWRAKVLVLPHNYEVIARMTWGSVGPDSGIFGPAQVGDLVLLAFDPELQEAFVISRLSSKEDTIPVQAGQGHTVVKSLPGKNTHIASDIKVLLGRLTSTDPTEPVVLGNILKTLLSYILDQLANQAQKISIHTHVGNLGANTSPPDIATDFVTLQTNFNTKKSSPVDDNAINSDVAFTEK